VNDVHRRWLLGILLVVLVAEGFRAYLAVKALDAAEEAASESSEPASESESEPESSAPREMLADGVWRYPEGRPGWALSAQGGFVPGGFSYAGERFTLRAIARREEALESPVVAAEVLAPRELEEDPSEAEPLSEDEYEVVEVEGVGRFHVDAIDDVIKDTLRRGRVWEPRIASLLGTFALPNTVAIDAGAHVGTHTITIARAVGEGGHVFAFEPQRKLHRELVANARLNELPQVTALRYALGDAPGVIEMAPAEEGNEGSTGVGSGGDRAELRTIDSFGFPSVSLMKIDVEGFEDPVLRGARETIEAHHPVILVEVQGGHSIDDAPPSIRRKIVGTIGLLEELGYYVVRVTAYDYLALPVTVDDA